jgi:hypothetical protein
MDFGSEAERLREAGLQSFHPVKIKLSNPKFIPYKLSTSME